MEVQLATFPVIPLAMLSTHSFDSVVLERSHFPLAVSVCYSWGTLSVRVSVSLSVESCLRRSLKGESLMSTIQLYTQTPHGRRLCLCVVPLELRKVAVAGLWGERELARLFHTLMVTVHSPCVLFCVVTLPSSPLKCNSRPTLN